MNKMKLASDLATGTGLSAVNGLDVNGTLILNAVIVLGRLALELIINRRNKRKQKNEQTKQESTN